MAQNRGYGTMDSNNKAGQQRRETGMLPCTNCLVSVPQDKFFAVERFGQFDIIIGPGLSCVGCDCCGICIGLRSITRRVEQNECFIETKTKDNVFVIVRVAVQQSVIPERAESALYKLADVGAQIDSYVADVVRSHVPKMMLDEAFENKDSISLAIQEQLGKHMSDYGFTIHKALVTELKPSQDVVNSMNEINKQKRLRDAAVMASEAEKIRIVVKAEADAESMRLQGVGIAKQRAAIVDGLKASIVGEADDKLSSERISELLLITQYFETLKEIGANARSQAVFIPHSPAEGVADIASQIRNGVMQGKVAIPAPRQAAME
mmetsp:Transcript_115272/g.321209  ORF Transcript_115272/g.321209 Transcript_115272/m.321209 type:complete len:321 (-) Transcript_115272:178-1140(-)